MARPTGLPQWASSPTNIAEPLSVHKVGGWATSEVPPSSFENYWRQNVYTWIRHLAYDRIIEDDFVRGTGVWSVAGQTVFHPMWTVSPSYVTIQQDQDNGALGTAQVIGPSGIRVNITANPGSPGSRDWQFEAIAKVTARGPSGSYLAIGGMSSYWFQATGQSAYWHFNFVPSNFSAPVATTVALNFDPVSSTAYQKFVIEGFGSTMTVSINGTVLASLPAVAPQYVNEDAGDVGVKIFSPNGAGGNISVIVDRISLGVRR